jgi:hypothetical protein
LKSLEAIVNERSNGYTAFLNNITKARPSFEGFETVSGSLKLAADAFYVFCEQVSLNS